jgi:hypothetical protein
VAGKHSGERGEHLPPALFAITGSSHKLVV